jgi:hypothetical protein
MKKLSPAMTAAMDQLTGTLDGKIRKGSGVRVGTARALHRRGLAYLDERAFSNGDWVLVLVEPEVREISDDQLLELPVAEAALLAPLAPGYRYRAARHAHIVVRHFGEKDAAAGYPQLARTYLEALRERVGIIQSWQQHRLTDREYSKYLDLAGNQWKSARTTPTNTWHIGTGWGEPVLVVEAYTGEEMQAKASEMIAADPVGYKELLKGFGSIRCTVQQWADARRVEAAVRAA